MGVHQFKNFCTTKETVTRLKKQSTKWEIMFDSYTYDKGLITRIYRVLKKLTSQRINKPLNPLNKWSNELNNSEKKKYKWPIKT
jgi:hypothetical protein